MPKNRKRKIFHNKDYRTRLYARCHGNLMLKYFQINDRVASVLDCELFTSDGKNYHLDANLKTYNGLIVNIEGETQVVRLSHIKKKWEYFIELNKLHDEQVISIIVALAEGNNLKGHWVEPNVYFKPFMLISKEFDGEEYLSIIRDKVEHKIEFTHDDVGIFEAIPDKVRQGC